MLKNLVLSFIAIFILLPCISFPQKKFLNLFNKNENQQLLSQADKDLTYIKKLLLSPKIPEIKNNSFIKLDSLIVMSLEEPFFKFHFEYNQNENMDEYLIYYFDDGNWYKNMKTKYFYNDELKISEIHFDWIEGKWDSSFKIINVYDLNKKLILSNHSYYNTEEWVNLSRHKNEYNSNSNLIKSVVELWENDHWLNSRLIEFFYTDDRKDSIYFRDWDGNNWINNIKSILFYEDTNVNPDSILLQVWAEPTWENYLKADIESDSAGNQIRRSEKKWESNTWVNTVRQNLSYYKNNYMLEGFCEVWINNNWVLGEGDLLFENPDGFSNGFLGAHKFTAYYTIVTEIKNNENLYISGYKLEQNYPNPFNPKTNIKYSIKENSKVILNVYDMLGSEVATLVNEQKAPGDYEVKFDAANLPSGVYFYRITAGKFSETRKMILLR